MKKFICQFCQQICYSASEIRECPNCGSKEMMVIAMEDE